MENLCKAGFGLVLPLILVSLILDFVSAFSVNSYLGFTLAHLLILILIRFFTSVRGNRLSIY